MAIVYNSEPENGFPYGFERKAASCFRWDTSRPGFSKSLPWSLSSVSGGPSVSSIAIPDIEHHFSSEKPSACCFARAESCSPRGHPEGDGSRTELPKEGKGETPQSFMKTMAGTMGSTRGDVDAKLSTWGFRQFDFVEAVNRIGAVRSPDQNLAPRPAESQRQLTLLLGARLESLFQEKLIHRNYFL
jgi:hypothetical protein